MSTEYPTAELRIPVPWGHIAAKTWGSPNDPRIVMVHGFLDNAGSFDRLIPLLPRSYYYLCIDLPGHGSSSHFPAGVPLDYFNYIFAIRIALDQLHWESCIYIGHSFGAHVGLEFSCIYPGRVTKILCFDAISSPIVTNDTVVPQVQSEQDNYVNTEEIRKVKLYTHNELIYMYMHSRFNSLNAAAAEALFPRSVTKVGDMYKLNRDPRLNRGLLPILNYEQHLTILKQLKTPAKIIFASTLLPLFDSEESKQLTVEMSLIEKYRFVYVEGDHDVHNNNPERVAPYVHQFLADIKSSL